jgi:uncharacterized protein YqjF (DUF2071 family)
VVRLPLFSFANPTKPVADLRGFTNVHPALLQIDHRPWPLPAGEWKWRQSWLNLAFIHYRVAADELSRRLPDGVCLQQFDGSAWVAVVPFTMSGVMRRPFPDVPGFSSFPELNLRTYVEVDGKPGVWFFSLDAASRLVVFGGRRIYNLPYHTADMRHEQSDGWHRFSSIRRSGIARFSARYQPIGEIRASQRGTFEHWATERYCLYSFSKHSGLARVDVHHAPWPLQRATVFMEESSILTSAGIAAIDPEPVCHFSTGVDVVAFDQEKLGRVAARSKVGSTIVTQ